jgi:hypothetical protein
MYELKPFQIRVDMIERLTVFLCHDQYGSTWETLAVETECREQAVKILAAIEEWLPIGVEHRPPVVEAGQITHPAEDRFVGSWTPLDGL